MKKKMNKQTNNQKKRIILEHGRVCASDIREAEKRLHLC